MHPNQITTSKTEDFYVSYNRIDASIYGSDTTALVTGQMQHFYILNGDHRAAYDLLIPKGLGVCLAYFRANAELINKYSEKLPPEGSPDE